jgi:hypothetical protein
MEKPDRIGADTHRRHPFGCLFCIQMAVKHRAAHWPLIHHYWLHFAPLASETSRKILNIIKLSAAYTLYILALKNN